MSATKSLVAAAPLLLIAAASPGRAACLLHAHEFFPERNDRVHVRVETDTKSFCDNSFREGPGYRFTDVSLVKASRQGLVATLGPNHFEYHAFPNRSGSDQYTIRACATVGERRGCSTLIYEVTIR